MQPHAVVHPLQLMDTPDHVQGQRTTEIISITTVHGSIVLVVTPPEDVSLVVSGQEVPRCV